MSLELIQGSPEWLQARCGSLGASQIALALAKTKSGWGASRENIKAQLVAERLTKTPTDGFVNSAMQWGKDQEPAARMAYEAETGYLVTEVGLVTHPRLSFSHASPDGLIDSEGLVEIKCPQTAQHIDTLLSETFDSKYVTQARWQMICTGRKWCDLVSFDPRMPENMRLFIKRINHDETRAAELEKEVDLFLREVATCYMALTAKYDADKAA